ncbi:MAG: deoxyribose-phosphate aldolase [Ignavibacteriaceae bacterium]
MNKLTSISKMIDHSLLHPTFTDKFLYSECIAAKELNVAAVCIKPYAVKMAKEILEGSSVKVCTVIGFPHGSNTIMQKINETEEACKDGAAEIDFVVNIGKVLNEDWNYVSNEIKLINEAVISNNAVSKVIFENDYYTEDKYKIRLCEICNEHQAAFVKTSTGYGFVKQPDGKYSYKGATDHDLILMREKCLPGIQVKAAGGIRTLDDLLRVNKIGVTRVGATATKEIISEAVKRGYK